MMMKFCNETTETMSGVSRPQECEKQVELFLFLFFSFWLWELLHDEKYERHTPNFYFFTACNYDMVFKCKLQHAN